MPRTVEAKPDRSSAKRRGLYSLAGSGVAFAVAALIIRAVEDSSTALSWGFGFAGIVMIVVAVLGLSVIGWRVSGN